MGRTTSKTWQAVKTLGHIASTITAEGAGIVAGSLGSAADGVNNAAADSFIGSRRDSSVKRSYVSGYKTGYELLELEKPNNSREQEPTVN